MHILIGALVGGAFAGVIIVAAALVLGRKITAKNVLLGILGGAVAGAVTTATLGASSLVGVTAARQVGAFALGGAAGGATERVADNAVEGRPLQDGVAKATAIGGGAGVVSLGLLKTSSATIGRIAPALAGRSGSAVSRLLHAPVPGTGGGIVRTFDEAVTDDEPLADDTPPELERDAASPEQPVVQTFQQAPAARAPPQQIRRGLSGQLGF